MEKFKTSLPGYNKEEVNRFVNDVIKEYESLLNRLKESDSKVIDLEKKLNAAKKEYNSLKDKNEFTEKVLQNYKKNYYVLFSFL